MLCFFCLKKVCRVWRYKVATRIQALFDKIRLNPFCSGLTELPKDLSWSTLDIESPKHLRRLRDHIVGHCEGCAGCPGQVSGLACVEELDAVSPMQAKYSWHWWLAHLLDEEAKQMWAQPREDTFYCCIDFQD